MKHVDFLILDDEPELRRSMREIIELEGFSVADFSDGMSALTFLSDCTANVVFCDISMPQMSGHDFLSEMKRRHIVSCVVMVTAHSESDRIIKSMQLGAFDYLVKPYDPAKLVERLTDFTEIGKRIVELTHSPPTSKRWEAAQKMIDLYRVKLALGDKKVIG